MCSAKTLFLLAKINKKVSMCSRWLGTRDTWTTWWVVQTAYFRTSHQTISRHWSVVSCVRCVRCGCWVLGLDSRWGTSCFRFHPQPPIWRDNSRGIPGGISRGISGGTSRGISRRISRCISRDSSRGIPGGISGGISEGWMAEKIPRQKWSISYLWEHFLVPEHQIPIWLVFVLGFSVRDGLAKHCFLVMKLQNLNISLDVLHLLKMTRRWNSQNPYFYWGTQTFGPMFSSMFSEKPL